MKKHNNMKDQRDCRHKWMPSILKLKHDQIPTLKCTVCGLEKYDIGNGWEYPPINLDEKPLMSGICDSKYGIRCTDAGISFVEKDGTHTSGDWELIVSCLKSLKAE